MTAQEEYLVTARSVDFDPDTGEFTWIDFISDEEPRPAPRQVVRIVRDAPGEQPIDQEFVVWSTEIPVPVVRPHRDPLIFVKGLSKWK